MYVVCSTLRESFTSISQNELSLALATHYSFPIKTKWSTLISLGVGINEKSAKIQLFSDEKISKAATYVLRHMDGNDEVWSCFSLRVCERYSPRLYCLNLLDSYKCLVDQLVSTFESLAWIGSRSLSTFEPSRHPPTEYILITSSAWQVEHSWHFENHKYLILGFCCEI